MKGLNSRVSINIIMRIVLMLLWGLWLVLAMSDCYQEMVYKSNEVVKQDGFITWLSVIFVVVEIVLLLMQRYVYVILGIIGCFLQTLLPIVEMLAINKMAELMGSIVYVRAPDEGYSTYYTMDITTRGYACVVVSLVLMMLHVYLCVKDSRKRRNNSNNN